MITITFNPLCLTLPRYFQLFLKHIYSAVTDICIIRVYYNVLGCTSFKMASRIQTFSIFELWLEIWRWFGLHCLSRKIVGTNPIGSEKTQTFFYFFLFEPTVHMYVVVLKGCKNQSKENTWKVQVSLAQRD